MQINSIGPTFKGYIKVTDRNRRYEGKTERIFNTNSIVAETFDYTDDVNNTYIKSQGKSYPCYVDFETLQKAILKADKNPDKIIDVESCKPKS